jgi:repressor LexA
MGTQVKPLTGKQRKVLNFINSKVTDGGYSPTLSEIANFLRTQNLSTAQYYVGELEKKGYLKRLSGGGITPLTKSKSIPLLGYIAAGEPIEPIENPEQIDIPRDIHLNPNYPYYALKVRGDSMIDMGVLDGDTVLIKHQMAAENGDIVVGVTEKGATLKVYKKVDNEIILEPRNNKYEVVKPKQLEIRGKFVGLIRG